MLSFTYYKDLFGIVTKHGKQKFAPEKKSWLHKRREAYKSKDEKKYREVVTEMLKKEETAFADVL
jgi:hypothetical protein